MRKWVKKFFSDYFVDFLRRCMYLFFYPSICMLWILGIQWYLAKADTYVRFTEVLLCEFIRKPAQTDQNFLSVLTRCQLLLSLRSERKNIAPTEQRIVPSGEGVRGRKCRVVWACGQCWVRGARKKKEGGDWARCRSRIEFQKAGSFWMSVCAHARACVCVCVCVVCV